MIFENAAKEFISEMPYKVSPYSNRNWGHKWHSLCSYHGKLKPAIANFLISFFTEIGNVVLDPLCGVGTIPFEAALQGRIGIGNDLSELAYCVSKAKLEKASKKEVMDVLDKLDAYVQNGLKNISFDDTPYRDFGLNRTLSEYFHPDTYREIILGRSFFVDRLQTISSAEATVFTAFLHVLHGNRPYALSRTSHPLTPYAPKGEFEYKNVVKHIRDKIDLAYKCIDFGEYVQGKAILGDFNQLNDINADAIITSPPFADSIRFYTQNWMRLWLCGWEPEDFKNADKKFMDQRQIHNFDIYYDFFKMCSRNLKDNGIVVLHLGKTAKVDMATELLKRSSELFTKVYLGSEDVKSIEKHGIKDKGGTVEHQFLFLQKK